MGIEPTTDIFCPPLDLKSRRPTRTCPLPFFSLKDFLFKVKGFELLISGVFLIDDEENRSQPEKDIGEERKVS